MRGATKSGQKAPKPAGKGEAEPAASARRLEIIAAAISVFRERGYQSTSMRDIADRAGILSGSLYHHFTSKDALYAEAHAIALERAAREISQAAAPFKEPWRRLEAAVSRHVELQVAPNSETLTLMSELPRVEPDLQANLLVHRDRFEEMYRELVGELPLDPKVDRRLFRTLLLSTVNAVPNWYRPGRRSAAEIGRQIVLIFRHDKPAK